MGLPFNVYWYKVVVCVCVFARHIKTTMRPSQPAALSSHCVSVKLSARDLIGEKHVFNYLKPCKCVRSLIGLQLALRCLVFNVTSLRFRYFTYCGTESPESSRTISMARAALMSRAVSLSTGPPRLRIACSFSQTFS
jgi:hypothetical protein